MKLYQHKTYYKGQTDGMNIYIHKNGTKVYAANVKDARLKYKAGLTVNT